MRVLVTSVLGVFAIAAFCVFFSLHSVLSYVDSPAAVTDTAREQALHELVLDAADTILESEFRPPPGPHADELRAFVRTEARAVFREVLSRDWFYETVAVAYTVVLAIVHDREDNQVIELADQKQRLLGQLDTVADKVADRCQQLIDGARCDDNASRRQALRPVRRAIESAIAQIPDRVRVQEFAATAGQRGLRRDSPEMKRVREGRGTLSLVRYIGLGALLLVLVLIALSNRPLSRMVCVIGAVLVVCSVIYLIGVKAAEESSRQWVAESMAERAARRLPAEANSVRGLARRGTEALMLGAAHDSIHHADGTVYFIGAASAVSFLLGIAFARRRA